MEIGGVCQIFLDALLECQAGNCRIFRDGVQGFEGDIGGPRGGGVRIIQGAGRGHLLNFMSMSD